MVTLVEQTCALVQSKGGVLALPEILWVVRSAGCCKHDLGCANGRRETRRGQQISVCTRYVRVPVWRMNPQKNANNEMEKIQPQLI